MDEKQLIEDAINLLEDQTSLILKAEVRYEADGTPYVVLLQDQGIGGVKKFRFAPEEIETRLAAMRAEAEPAPKAKAGNKKNQG